VDSQRRKEFEADIELGSRVFDVTHAPNFPVVVELLTKWAAEERAAANQTKHEHSKVVEHLSRAEAYESVLSKFIKIEERLTKAKLAIESADGQ
jgi:hypothetical protein